MAPLLIQTRPTNLSHVRQGFTLVELLVVIAILVALAVLTMPATTSLSKAIDLGQTASSITGALQTARLEALSRNRIVEVRLIQSSTIFGDEGYRAIQIFARRADGAFEPLSAPIELPDQIVLSEDSDASTLLDDDNLSPSGLQAGSAAFQSLGNKTLSYFAFQFRSDGSTNLESDSLWYMTLIPEKDSGTPASELSNFATIQVDPTGGTTRLLRPN